jgi:hypothetical protein
MNDTRDVVPKESYLRKWQNDRVYIEIFLFQFDDEDTSGLLRDI